MANDLIEPCRLIPVVHPENRPELRESADPVESTPARPAIGFGRALAGVWIGGAIGCLLTLMTLAWPLGAGDTTAALSILPLVLVLIAVVNGWMATNLVLGGDPPR